MTSSACKCSSRRLFGDCEDSRSHVDNMRLILIRHSARADYADRSWTRTAARPWDTPLTVAGEDLALQKGREIAATMVEKFPQFQNVARAYCSPFLRCVQTLSRMIPSMPPGPVPLQICVEPAVCEFMAAEWYASWSFAHSDGSWGCSSPAAASAKLEPSRAEAAVPAGSIMLPPSGLQTLLGDSCLINADFAPFRAYGDVQHTFLAPETEEAQQLRLLQWIKQMEKVHADETIVVCTHGGCMLVLEAALADMPLSESLFKAIPSFCGSIWLSNDSGKWVTIAKFVASAPKE